MNEATLAAHCNSDKVTRDELAHLAPVEGTETFRPVQHIELVEHLDKAVHNSGLRILNEQYALRRDGKMMFGVLKIGYRETGDFVTALGLRQGLDRTMSIQMCAGASVFVCDNLAFRGDMIVLKQPHRGDFDLDVELGEAVGRWRNHADELVDEIGRMKTATLTDDRAKALICDVFAKGIMPTRFLPAVYNEYAAPTHAEFAPRTAWSLSNAFTEVQKQMPMTSRVDASQELGAFLRKEVL